MKEVYKPLLFLLLIAAAAFVFAYRLLAIGGINPNLPLIVFSLLASAPATRKMNFWEFLLLVVLFSGLLLLVSDLWTAEIAVFSALLVGAFYASRFLTGTWLYDFLIMQAAMSLVFYGLSALILRAPLVSGFIFYEIVYDTLLSLAAYPLLRKLAR